MDTLFAIYVGGLIEGCHVELHDLRFAIGGSVEDCHDALRAQWWGAPESLHLDAWGPIRWADGFAVRVASEPPSTGGPRLWLCNMGGYDPTQFTELHENHFIVAPDARSAKQRALARLPDWASPHRDATLEIETIVDIAVTTGRPDRFVHLTPAPTPQPFRFEARYTPIGRVRP